jgi:hypothetical protein
MTDLDQNPSTQSPRKKFSFRFPHLSHSAGHDGSSGSAVNGHSSNHQQNSNYKEKRNFSEAAKNAPDLQVSFKFQTFYLSLTVGGCN